MTHYTTRRRPIQPDNILLPLLVLATLGGCILGIILSIALEL